MCEKNLEAASKQAITITPVFYNKEQESYYKQRNRLRIINKSLYREYIDESGNVIVQYVVPSHLRDIHTDM